MPRTGVAWRLWSFVAFVINDYGDESEHRRGVTRGHAMRRLVRSFRLRGSDGRDGDDARGRHPRSPGRAGVLHALLPRGSRGGGRGRAEWLAEVERPLVAGERSEGR